MGSKFQLSIGSLNSSSLNGHRWRSSTAVKPKWFLFESPPNRSSSHFIFYFVWEFLRTPKHHGCSQGFSYPVVFILQKMKTIPNLSKGTFTWSQNNDISFWINFTELRARNNHGYVGTSSKVWQSTQGFPYKKYMKCDGLCFGGDSNKNRFGLTAVKLPHLLS
jgi:hypothetical protein